MARWLNPGIGDKTADLAMRINAIEQFMGRYKDEQVVLLKDFGQPAVRTNLLMRGQSPVDLAFDTDYPWKTTLTVKPNNDVVATVSPLSAIHTSDDDTELLTVINVAEEISITDADMRLVVEYDVAFDDITLKAVDNFGFESATYDDITDELESIRVTIAIFDLVDGETVIERQVIRNILVGVTRCRNGKPIPWMVTI